MHPPQIKPREEIMRGLFRPLTERGLGSPRSIPLLHLQDGFESGRGSACEHGSEKLVSSWKKQKGKNQGTHEQTFSTRHIDPER
jgi:hypothetical protein